jgi:hypothetical protein
MADSAETKQGETHQKETHQAQVRLVLSYLLVKAGVTATLHDYQLDGLARMLFQQSWTGRPEGHKANLEWAEDYGYFGRNYGLGIMQSDATGLGKTLQTLALCEVCRYIAFIDDTALKTIPPTVRTAVQEIRTYAMTRRLANHQPVLVSCPLSVLDVWRQELDLHTSVPPSRILTYHGSTRDKTLQTLRQTPLADRPLYVLTTPQTLVSDGGLRHAKAKRTTKSFKKFPDCITAQPSGLASRAALFARGNRMVRAAPMRTPILERMRASGALCHILGTPLSERHSIKSYEHAALAEATKASRVAQSEALRRASKHRRLTEARATLESKEDEQVPLSGGPSPVWPVALEDLCAVAPPLDVSQDSHWVTKGFWFRQPLACLLMDEAPYSQTSSMWQALYALTQDPFLFRVVMTASPICNSVSDLAARLTLAGFSPFEWGSPSYLSLIDPRPAPFDKEDGVPKETIDSCASMVQRLRKVAMISRPKAILGPRLPPLIKSRPSVTLSSFEQHFYNDCLRNTAAMYSAFLEASDVASRQSAWSATLLRLLRLRQATIHPAATLGRTKVAEFCRRETAWLLWKASVKTRADSAKVGDDRVKSEGETKADLSPPEPPRPSDPVSNLMRHESSKFAACAAIIKKNQGCGVKTLVISQWTAVMDLFEIYLFSCHQMRAPKFDGRLGLEERSALLTTFKTADPADLPTMLLQLQAGGVGLTITGTEEFPVSDVVFLDSWFNPCVEDQARDRVWRQSQTRTVTCHTLDALWSGDPHAVAAGTIDTAVRRLQATKREMSKVYIGHGEETVEWEAAMDTSAHGITMKEAQTLLDAVIAQDRARE